MKLCVINSKFINFMKRVLFFTIAIMTLSFVKAQDISYGLKAGLNLSDWHTSNADANDIYKMKTAFHVGGFVQFGLSDKFAVQPEVLYNVMGTVVDVDVTALRAADADSFTYALSYISVPVMLQYKATDALHLELGPQLGILMSANQKYDGESEDFKDELETVDFGVNIGAGYQLENGLLFNVRYCYGLSNFVKDTGDEWYKNNVFQFSVGYKFN